MVTIAKYHIYGWYLSRTRISRISRIYFFVASNGYSHLDSQWKNSEGVEIREIREIRVGKIQHLTFKINHYESKLEIRHQFRHHCPHRCPQLFLHAELQVIASEHESNESYLFKGHIRVIREIRVQLNICSKDIFVSFEKFVFS